MLTMTLPRSPDRVDLDAFWLAACTLATAAGVAVVLLLGGGSGGIVAVFGVTGLAAGLGVRRQRVPLLAYRLWNDVARGYAGIARGWVLAVCYWVVFPVVGRTGSRLPVEPEPGDGTSWTERSWSRGGRALSRSLRDGGPLRQDPRSGWRWLVSWAQIGEQAWVLLLLPFLILLQSLEPESGDAPPADLYTLY